MLLKIAYTITNKPKQACTGTRKRTCAVLFTAADADVKNDAGKNSGNMYSPFSLRKLVCCNFAISLSSGHSRCSC